MISNLVYCNCSMACGVSSEDNLTCKVRDLQLEVQTCTCTNLSTEDKPVWPSTSRKPSIPQPLTFPETPKKDLSLFTDPSKDQPIHCFICDQTFPSSRDCEARDVLPLETTETESKSNVDVTMQATVTGSEERSKVKLSLQPKDEWLRHLLLEHKIVIHQVSDICSLKW